MTFKIILEKYSKLVDDELSKFLTERIDEVKDPYLKQNYTTVRNYVLNRGKRLRPVALIMAYKGVGGKNKNIYQASLSVELMHASTLVHDDVMDEDDLRRNMPTIHKLTKDIYLKHTKETNYNGNLFSCLSSRYSVANAICIGNILQVLGMNCLSVVGKNLSAARAYSAAYRVVNDGQILDNYFEIKKKVTEADYLDMIARKTGNLFRAAVQIGAILGKANKVQLNALSNYAILTAAAFQLKDDLMDIGKDTKKGSTYCSDIKKGKRTLILIKALENADKKQKKILNEVAGNDKASLTQINQVIDIYNKTGAIDYVTKLAETNINKSKEWLAKARLSEESMSFFEGFADYMLERKI